MPLLLTLLTTVAVSLATATVVLADDDAAPRHVTAVSGSRDHGFHVVWSDGEEWWTPTLSEELALCQEYDRPVRRGRCRAATRTTYRWMGVVKRSLRHHAR
ncbi:MAG: hypothetical protein M3165_00855 [Actinomycetota bacterium]|nr:hypothetical protein [Actinomycetota bacterium]